MAQEIKEKLALTLTVPEGDGQNKDFAKLMQFFGHAMLGKLASFTPEIKHTFPNGRTWSMRLITDEVGEGKILEVVLPMNEQERVYFKPLTEENWPDFVALVKMYGAGMEKDARARIPELYSISFKPKNVSFPRALAKKDNPVLVGCTATGAFLPSVITLEILTNYYATLTETNLSSTS